MHIVYTIGYMIRFILNFLLVIFITAISLFGFEVYSNNFGTKPSSPVITTAPNQIYSGYLASELSFPEIPADGKKQYTSIFGSWKVPEVKRINNNENSYSAVWVGLGGINGSLEQVATVIHCINGNPVYEARYQVINKNSKTDEGSQLVTDLHGTVRTVKAGDNITAGVIHLYKGKYLLAMLNSSQRWLFLKVVSGSEDNSGINAAEWIVESPIINNNVNYLTATEPVKFTNCFSNFTPIIKCNTVNKMISMSGDTIKAYPGSISSGGNGFTVEWKDQGRIETFNPYIYQQKI